MFIRTLPESVSKQFVIGWDPLSRGKVRDTYPVPKHDELLLTIASDRLSVFDLVTGAEVEDKGPVLTAMNFFWRTGPLQDVIGKNHDLVSVGKSMDAILPTGLRNSPSVQKRGMIIKCHKPLAIEGVVRGYLTGSSLAPYNESHTVCGHVLPGNLFDGAELPEPIFTPTTKAEVGHDKHVSAENVCKEFGPEPERFALELYKTARNYARERGIIIADTKFEFALDDDGKLVLIDEVLTPDSSRFWPEQGWLASQKRQKSPDSLDKQYARDFLKGLNVDLLDPENPKHVERVGKIGLPPLVRRVTTLLYRYAFWRLAGMKLERFQREKMGIDVSDRRSRIEILIGSETDRNQVEPMAHKVLKGMADYRISVVSCHRNDNALEDMCRLVLPKANAVIACAGKAAALPGIVKSKLCKHDRFDVPVIGVALKGETEADDRDATGSIAGLPGQPVELRSSGQAHFGPGGVEDACLRALREEFMPRKIEAKPSVLGEWMS